MLLPPIYKYYELVQRTLNLSDTTSNIRFVTIFASDKSKNYFM